MINAESKIKTASALQAAMVDTLKNPPKSELEAGLWLTKHVDFSATFGKTVSSLIPGIGSIFGALTDIFSVFSSPPSLGEMVLDGINSLSNQISELKNELTSVIEKTAEMQTIKTVDFVLQGVDEIQREVSAVQVMQSINEEARLRALALEKAQIYTQYLAEYSAMQSSAYAEIAAIVSKCENELTELYAALTLRFGDMGLDFFKYLESLTAQQPQAVTVSRSAPGEALAPVQAAPADKKTGFNWLYLSPLLLLFFTNKKK